MRETIPGQHHIGHFVRWEYKSIGAVRTYCGLHIERKVSGPPADRMCHKCQLLKERKK